MAMAHATHAMETAAAGFRSHTVPDTSHGGRVASADVSSTLAMDATTFTMNAAAFAVDGLSVLRVQRCLTRSMSVAHEPAEVQAVVVSNLAPALASLVHCHEV